jgi:putative hydrolase of HD superfamily
MNAQAILDLMEEVGKLKLLPRTGWLLRGLRNVESIADHSYRVSLLAMVLADCLNDSGMDINVESVMRIALIHDIAESQIGDIPHPATRYIPEDIKEKGERAAVQEMVAAFGNLGDRYIALWQSFEDASTIEAEIVRVADKLEMMIQAFEYESVGYRSLNDFWANTANFRHFSDYPLVQEMMTLLQERRSTR